MVCKSNLTVVPFPQSLLYTGILRQRASTPDYKSRGLDNQFPLIVSPLPEAYPILDIESELVYGSCFIEAALPVPRDWKVLRTLQQAFNVPGQLTATVLVSGFWFSSRYYIN